MIAAYDPIKARAAAIIWSAENPASGMAKVNPLRKAIEYYQANPGEESTREAVMALIQKYAPGITVDSAAPSSTATSSGKKATGLRVPKNFYAPWSGFQLGGGD
jgi:hypothetical protein